MKILDFFCNIIAQSFRDVFVTKNTSDNKNPEKNLNKINDEKP